MPNCPECEAVLDIDMEEVEEGQLVSCPDCGLELEVVSTNPVELDLAEDEDVEDEDDDEDEDFDDDDEMDYDEDDEEEDDEDEDEDDLGEDEE